MRAILYARVSSQEQNLEGCSLAAQESRMRQFCELYDVEIVKVIVDGGQSAKSLNRPGLQEALATLDAGEADGLVIYRLDRLTRSISDWAWLIERYFGKRHCLMSVCDQLNTGTASGRMITNLLVLLAQWERETGAERTSTALAHLKANGMHVGRPPYGHEIRDGRLIMQESYADLIEFMGELRRQGHTLQQICDELEARHVPTPRGGSRWYPATVRNILARAA